MTARHLILLLLNKLGGTIDGKTKLHKELYFLSMKLNLDLDFRPHHYGPYSIKAEQGIDELSGAGFIKITEYIFGYDTRSGFEMKRYHIDLLDSGKRLAKLLEQRYQKEVIEITKFIEKIKEAGDPDYLILSIAAKTYYILNKEGRSMKREEICNEAKKFDWQINSENIENAIKVLQNLDLVTTAS